MLRHPRHLEIPWEVHWDPTESGAHYLLLMLIVIFMAMLLIGVGVTRGFA